jgi:hypothetical protein
VAQRQCDRLATAGRREREAAANAELALAGTGNPVALAAVRARYDADGGAGWEQIGNIAGQAERALVRAIAGDNEVVDEAIVRKLNRLRVELAGAEPTRLQLLLVSRVVTTWLQLAHADLQAVPSGTQSTIEQADFTMRRQDSASRRYLAACRALAQIQRLAVPDLEVSVVTRQVAALPR